MKKILLTLILFGFLVSPTQAYFTWKPKGWGYTRTYAMSEEEQEDRLWRLINNYRENRDLKPLNRSIELDEITDRKIKRVVACPKRLRHDACGIPVFFELDQAGFRYKVARENLAHMYKGNEYHAFRIWLDSPEGHRETLLSDCTEVGISASIQGDMTFYVFECIKI